MRESHQDLAASAPPQAPEPIDEDGASRLDHLYPERDVQSKYELLHTLRELRRKLVQHADIAAAVKALRTPVSRRDFFVSVSSLVVGTALQPVAFQYAPYLLPALVLLQLGGLAGFNSLAHESWHHAAYPGKRNNRVLSDWVIAPLLLRNFEPPRKDHIDHHKMPGEPEDAASDVWAQKPAQFRRSMLNRLLVLPAAIDVLRGMVTGKRAHAQWDEGAHKLSHVEIVRVLLLHGVWFSALAWFAPWTVLTGWALPMALGSAAAHLREYAEHARTQDGRTVVYDTLCPAWQRVLIPGGYFNLHALHHMFPEIPQRNLPKLYGTIARSVKMDAEYYGFSPQIRRQHSYLDALHTDRTIVT